jgi:hypothetical protein
MPARLIQLLAFAAALYGTGAMIVMLSHFDGNGAARVATTAAATVESIPTLPTVIVRPEPEIPVLAAITVVPDRNELAAAGVRSHSLGVLAAHASAALAPSGGFDMPYYSFGRTLNRVNKE